ncbi:MAG: DUF2330 domain-containing protein [Candidatus Brocadiia bacterium]
MKKWLLIAFGLVLLFGAQPHCFADGLIFPAQGGKEPQLVQQRAIIVYRDGVERLIVESAFDGEPGEYAFILPVPSEPIAIKRASYPLFKTLFYDLRLKAQNWDSITAWTICLLSGLVAIIIIFFVLALLNGRAALFARLGSIVLAVTFIAVVWRLTPSLAVPLSVAAVLLFLSGRFPKVISAVTCALLILTVALLVTPAARRGIANGPVNAIHIPSAALLSPSGETRVAADSSEGVAKWLTEEGFSAPGQEARKAIQSLADNGCRFVVVKGHKAATGLSAALTEVSFKADRPTLPPVLAASAGREIFADVVVVADGAFASEALRTEFSYAFKDEMPGIRPAFAAPGRANPPFRKIGQPVLDRFWVQILGFVFPSYMERGFLFHWYDADAERTFRHSEAYSLLWDGCVISKLSGPLPTKPGAADTSLKTGSIGTRAYLETGTAAELSALEDAFTFLLVAAILASIPLLFLRRYRQWRFVRTGGIFLAAAGAAVLFGLAMLATISTAEPQDPREYWSSFGNDRKACEEAFMTACQQEGGPAQKLLAMYDKENGKWPEMNDEMRDLLAQLGEMITAGLADAGVKNEVTGGPCIFEESPGNVFIELERGKTGRLSLQLFKCSEWWSDTPIYLCTYPR